MFVVCKVRSRVFRFPDSPRRRHSSARSAVLSIACLDTMLAQALIGLGCLCIALGGMTIHSVNEGHVGVYWQGGALLEDVVQPGFHFKLPLLTSYAEVQVTVQTDSVRDIPCGTSGGVMVQVRFGVVVGARTPSSCAWRPVQFDKVEVVNRLREKDVFDTVKNYTLHYDQTWVRCCIR